MNDKLSRQPAFLHWWSAQHVKEIEAAASALCLGQPIRLWYDAETKQVRMEPAP